MATLPLKVQIVDGDDRVLQFPGGSPLEADLLKSCTDAILARGVGSMPLTLTLAIKRGLDEVLARCVHAVVARGVGVLRTEAHVTQAIHDGLREVLTADLLTHQALSWDSREAEEAIRLGLKDAIQSLKAQTRFVV